jgi:hypothetical protein
MKILALTCAALLCAALPLVTPRSVRTWGVLMLGLSFVAISWNAVHITGSTQPADLLLLAALVLAVANSLMNRDFVRLPMLAGVGAGLIGLSGLLSALFPTPASYLTRRYEFVNPYEAYGGHQIGGSNLTQLTKFEIALVALPMTVLLLRPTARELRRLGDCFVLSALVNSAVGITDFVHLTAISPKLLGFTDITGRASGLTIQPNHLAASAVLALPLAMHWFVRSERRLLAAPAVALLVAGVFVTGSRGGCVLAGLVCLGCFIAFDSLRKRLWMAFALVPVVLVLRVPQLAMSALQNRVGAQASDNQRALLRQQGLKDFFTHPLHGIGFENITAAHEVHVQLLAAGGVLAFVGYFLYLAGVGTTLRTVLRIDSLGVALMVALVTVFAMHFVENQLTDRYLVVPFALAFALAETHRHDERPPDAVDDDPPTVLPSPREAARERALATA